MNFTRYLGRVLFLSALLCYWGAFAQAPAKIRGVVNDEHGDPLPGALVRIVGSSEGTATDVDGAFVLHRKSKKKGEIVLEVRYVGMKTVHVPWKGVPLTIGMTPNVEELEGVSVTARPNINDIDIRSRSGVVAEVDMKQLTNTPTIDFTTALQGNVPGLMVVNRGELGVKPEIRLRGTTSFRRGDRPNEPLYVLDGQVISPEAFVTLNPLDIREIRVLKDAVANALYGVKAANGVLEITSKRGSPGPLTISVSSNMGITLRGKRPIPMMRTAEKLAFEEQTRALNAPGYILSEAFFREQRKHDIQNVYRDMYGIKPTENMQTYTDFAEKELQRLREIDTDWFLELMHPNVYHNHNVSFRGGDDEILYYVSGNFSEQGGQLPGNKVWRSTLRTSLDLAVRDMGYITLSTSLGFSETDSPNSSTYSPQQMVETLNPYESRSSDKLYSYRGKRYSDLTNQYRSKGNNYRVGTSVGINLKPFEVLRIDGILGVDYLLSTRENITPATAFSQRNIGKTLVELGEISSSKDNEVNTTSNIRLTYNQVFDERHDLTVSANTDYYYTYGHALTVRGHGIGQLESLAGVNKSIRGAYRPDFSGYVTRIAQMGLGLAVGYTYDGKVDLFGSVKGDATNLLPKSKRWNTAWALGAGVHLLPLLDMDGGLLSDLSLKSSYGHTASLGGVSASLTIPIFRYNQEGYYGEYFRNLYLSDLYNLNLRAEKVQNYDLGLSVAILDARHRVDLQFYNRKTVDALLMVSVPSSNGFRTMMQNVGILLNRGIECSIANTWVQVGDFSLSTRASIAYNQNRVLDLYDGPVLYSSEGSVVPDYEVGKPYDILYGFQSVGIHPLDGYPMYRDAEGKQHRFTLNPKRSDLVDLGHTTPPYQGTLGLSISYGGLSVDAQLYYVLGGVKPYMSNVVRDKASAYKNALRGQLAKTWLREGDDDKLYPDPNFNSGVLFLYPNSRMIARSDYLRFSMLSLNYRIPPHFLDNSLGGIVKYASIGIQASNLFTLSPYRGSNPEAGVHDTGIQPVISASLSLNF